MTIDLFVTHGDRPSTVTLFQEVEDGNRVAIEDGTNAPFIVLGSGLAAVESALRGEHLLSGAP